MRDPKRVSVYIDVNDLDAIDDSSRSARITTHAATEDEITRLLELIAVFKRREAIREGKP